MILPVTSSAGKSMLQCVVVCCRGLQCAAEDCSLLQSVAVCCSLLQSVALCCTLLHSVAVCCSLLTLYPLPRVQVNRGNRQCRTGFEQSRTAFWGAAVSGAKVIFKRRRGSWKWRGWICKKVSRRRTHCDSLQWVLWSDLLRFDIYMYVYICMCIGIYIYMNVFVYVYVYVYIYDYVNIYIYVHLYVYIYRCIRICIDLYTCIDIYT